MKLTARLNNMMAKQAQAAPDPKLLRAFNRAAARHGFALDGTGGVTGTPDELDWVEAEMEAEADRPLFGAPSPSVAGPYASKITPGQFTSALSPDFQDQYWIYLRELIKNSQRGPLTRALRNPKYPKLSDAQPASKQAQQHTLLGAGIGTAAGAGIGALTGQPGNRLRRALAGGLLGGATGGAVGHKLDRLGGEVASLQSQLGLTARSNELLRRDLERQDALYDEVKELRPSGAATSLAKRLTLVNGHPDQHADVTNSNKYQMQMALRSQGLSEGARRLLADVAGVSAEQWSNSAYAHNSSDVDRVSQFDRARETDGSFIAQLLQGLPSGRARSIVDQYNNLRRDNFTHAIFPSSPDEPSPLPEDARELLKRLIQNGIITAGTQNPGSSNYA